MSNNTNVNPPPSMEEYLKRLEELQVETERRRKQITADMLKLAQDEGIVVFAGAMINGEIAKIRSLMSSQEAKKKDTLAPPLPGVPVPPRKDVVVVKHLASE
jgi:hypothetical protein